MPLKKTGTAKAVTRLSYRGDVFRQHGALKQVLGARANLLSFSTTSNMANQHVVQRPDGTWAVRGERNERDTSRHDTQGQAIKEAKKIAENQGGDAIIHGRDGKIRERDTHGKRDPFPPKG